jgi:hypothetical protein
MNLKSLIGIAALAAMVGAPLGAAHMDSTAWVVEGTAADPGLTSTASGGADRVSGVYYGSVSALVGHTGNPVNSQPTTFEFGTAFALCDMEILSDGSTGSAEDEAEIDGVTNSASAVPTLFNDGGVGAACHTQQNYYPNANFNEDGCSVYSDAMGEDAVAADVWLTTVCSYAYTTSGPGLIDYFVDCSNTAISGSPLGVVDCATTTADCFVNGACTSLADAFTCGPDADGNADVQAAGESDWGSAGAAFPTSFPNPAGACADSDTAAVVFVWNAVFVDSTGATPSVTGVSTPTVGVIY